MMRIASSLTNRIFLACTLLATLSLGFAFYFVNARATSEAETVLERDLMDASTLVDQQRAVRTDLFTQMAELAAEEPTLRAALDTGDPPTVEPIAESILQHLPKDMFIVADRHGRVLASGGDGVSAIDTAEGATTIDEFSRLIPHERGLLQIISLPICSTPPCRSLAGSTADVLGRLTLGFFLDDALAKQFRGTTASEIAFGIDGRVLASSLPESAEASLSRVTDTSDISRLMIANEEFVALARPIRPTIGMRGNGTNPVVLTLRSRTERLRFLKTVRNGLVGALILTVLLATLLSYAVARTMTRPLAAITSAMRHVATTGDLTRKVAVRSRAWDDEDARLLASTFNTLTESISRFQQQAAQKDRLTSLGRLSTVIAHEIRNPLMIISATLATLRRDLSEEEFRDAVDDIDGETWRLNRIVSDVLDFARPIRFELAEADINDTCRHSVAAAWAGAPHDDVCLELDPSMPVVVTDAERVRTVLVNMLSNARHAIESAEPAPAIGIGSVAVAGAAAVTLRTARNGDRVTITIQDRGMGIAPEDMVHIFDPYFTTRKAGTGLGLPISKNIVDGLGGRIDVRSTPGAGTTIVIDLPLTAPGATE
ncbi:MAG TPA: ATP-binding protein [Vicinamibacterales bacterium]|jgi:signal transduction histidine kinase|nr:ATP-binding protein [Vicinamibacterales bacterium]